MLGIIALQIDNKQIESKVVNNFQNPSSDIVSTNIYLVNRDGTIINNMIDRSNKIVTKIDTQMYVDCFDSYIIIIKNYVEINTHKLNKVVFILIMKIKKFLELTTIYLKLDYV